jgi:predicted lipid-binding transport protein (Tim44 family)
MKLSYALIPLAALVLAGGAIAQTKIFRCGNSYTNDEAVARVQNCKLVEGGNVTVVTGTRVAPTAAQPAARSRDNVATAPQSAGSSGQRVNAGDQKARDNDARAILEAELKKAESRQTELLQEWNKGEPEKLGPEHRNHQKYLDRVAELKAAIERNEKDIAGLKRELGRASAAN